MRSDSAGGDLYQLTAPDDRMDAARVYPGARLIVRQQSSVAEMDIVAVQIPGDQLRICRMVSGPDAVTLVPDSTNPEYKPETFPSKSVRVIGRVVESIIDLLNGPLPLIGAFGNPNVNGGAAIPVFDMGGDQPGGINTVEGWNSAAAKQEARNQKIMARLLTRALTALIRKKEAAHEQ